jgi:predicted ribosome quality control (RQC) complex YloA/Tae2 family protein
MRKHLEGLVFQDITQPPGDRILVFTIGGYKPQPGDMAPAMRSSFRLIIEAISQYSNLVLVDERGIVLDAIRRVTAEQNRTRVTLPHHPYHPPPGQPKQTLDDTGPAACLAALEKAAPSTTIWQALVSFFAGLGPVSAREVTFRATGDPKARVPSDARSRSDLAARVAETLTSIVIPVRDDSFVASVARDREVDTTGDRVLCQPDIIDFAPFALTHLPHWEARQTLSAAAAEFYRQSRGIRAIDVARRATRAAIAAERALAEKKRESLRRALEGTTNAESLRLQGELLLAYSSTIPRGAASFRADGVDLELDPRLSAVEYAQQLFRRYRKARAALREVPALLEEAETRLRYLDEVDGLAEVADTTDALRALRSDVRPIRDQPGPQRRGRRSSRTGDGILRLRTRDNHEILVGRTAQQNNLVTFDLAQPNDIWLHARGCPGAHVILRATEAEPMAAEVLAAAQIAAYYSTNRSAGKVTVDWTRRRNVRKIAKSTPGLVTYSGERTLVVEPSAILPTEQV